ncbi:serine/arginine repetitive matrix protein 2 isoform X2 [Phycodurus eques]|uniref:serine/arginine repetitive matrix protein 2 isoform X2 n=1 Tax=Phycodurus eques TaxID=693459 RepID=UPI002ACD6267|nr:serine/arginine repetitive matrix protein 2 isoform X2 [Phycodurus eques]
MRLTWSAMLQHNNNNNYPCQEAAHREAPLKCASASRLLPGRMELGLGDLPLIRGLRAWALCSKNRQKAGVPAGGRRAPVTPPAGRRTSRPGQAGVDPSGAWGSGYGLPRAGAGALVTVATLKTSEGNGKTQTQCLFLRNDKGSYSYAASGGTSGAGGWLRGKSGTGTGRQDIVSALQTQTAASRVRARSGRRWRKSGHPVGREKRHLDKEVCEKQEKLSKPAPRCLANPEEEACREHGGPRGTPGRLQNWSAEEGPRTTSHAASQDDKSDEEVTVKQEELDKVCPDCLSSPQGDACKKSRGPGGSPGFHQIPSDEESQTKSSHVANRDERLPEEEVTEKQEEPDKVSPERLASPEAGVGRESGGLRRRPGCLRNASNEESPSREGTLSGMKGEWEQTAEEDEKGNELCRNDPCISAGPNPDLESSRSHAECEGGKDSVNMTKRPDEEESTIRATFGHTAATSRCPEASHTAGGGACQDEGCQVGRALGNSDKASNGNLRRGKELDWVPKEFVRGCMPTPAGPRPRNPTPSPPLSATVATGRPRAEAEEKEGGKDGAALESRDRKQEEEEEEDEFGGFMQAGGGEECGQGGAVSAPLPCGSSAAFGSSAVSGESSDRRPARAGSPDARTAFRRDAAGRRWPDEGRTHDEALDRRLARVFATAFPSLPTSAPRLPADVIPTLAQLLESSSQEQRLLDGFRDVGKMSARRYKRGGGGGGVSRSLLLSSLRVEQPNAARSADRRPSPCLRSPNRHPRDAAARRRLSGDCDARGPK